MSKEAQFLGSLFPSHPVLIPIIEAVREKYKLPYITPDDDTIEEIYFGDEIIPLEEFRQDIEDRVRENLDFFPQETIKLYQSAKMIVEMKEIKDIDSFSGDIRTAVEAMFKFMKDMMQPYFQILDAQIVNVANMLYEYILTGEAGEIPGDWISKVAVIQMQGEPTIMALASEVADIEIVVDQLRKQFRKTFGANRPKLTPKKVSAAYYMQLRRLGKKWSFIFEEYIRLNKISLPRDTSSKRYFDIRQKHERNLRRIIDRSENVLNVIIK